MDIYVPKYKDIIVTQNSDTPPGLSAGVKGEYRMTLRGPDGRVKYTSGWKDNTILDRGLALSCQMDIFYRIYLGDSAAPVVTSQVGLQGALTGDGSYEYFAQGWSSKLNLGAPTYARETIGYVTFAAGQCTGTINEFVMVQQSSYSPYSQGTVRVALTTPVVKGANDELKLEHKFTWYPQVIDTTGDILISDVEYTWTARHTYIHAVPGGHPGAFYPNTGGYGGFRTGELGAATDGYPQGNSTGYPNATGGVTYGGGPTTYWSKRYYTTSVDHGNSYSGLIRSWYTDIVGVSGSCGMQMRWGKKSDDTVLQKLNTHVLYFGAQLFQSRHTP